MFMLLWNRTSGLVSKTITLPPPPSTRRWTKHRSRELWMKKMDCECKNPVARPVKVLPGDARLAAETLVEHYERKHADG